MVVEFLGDPYILKDGHILEPLEGIEWPKVYNHPLYDLMVPSDKVNGIKNSLNRQEKYFGYDTETKRCN
jgi:hypothetical protein